MQRRVADVAGGRKERAEEWERGIREGRASEARASTWHARWSPHHLLTTRPTPPTSRPPPPTHTTPHVSPPRHPHPTVSPAHPLADSVTALPAPTSTRLPRVCSGAVLAHADAAVARAHGSQILYNLARGWPRAETGPVRTHVMPRILQSWAARRHTHALPSAECSWDGGCPVGARQQLVSGCTGGGCLGRRMAMPPSLQPSTQPGRSGGIDRVTVDDHIFTSAGRRGGLWRRGQSKRWVACR